ncbi:MAG: hybrid sensor histidine kinase/response regulator [Anaerolinea sp.]|nr:hybrid sensor histidine kinase/response regulator [Anaerolinea sp.]
MSKIPCICIVDDHIEVRQSLSDFLARDHYHLLTFSSGIELLAYDDTPMPDVILLDVMMPGMDGFAVCAQIKAAEKWQHIPVILVTALSTRDYMLRGLESGAEEYLAKPINGLELRARVRSMLRIKQQYDDLKATLALREKLANMLVHDLRQPLNAALLRGFLIIRRNQLSAADHADVQIVQTQLRRMNSLTNDILVAAKMQGTQFLLETTPVDLKKIIQEMAPDYHLMSQAAQAKLTIDLPQMEQLSLLDANLIIRLIDNLVNNAIKFSPQGGVITLRLDYPQAATHQARLQVIDEGPGIPPAYQDEIFDEYRTLAMHEKNGLQIGLGLAFCKMVVEAHNGRIYVTPNTPTGSIFTVEL